MRKYRIAQLVFFALLIGGGTHHLMGNPAPKRKDRLNLFKVTDPNNKEAPTLLIHGTVHVGSPALYPLAQPIEEQLRKSDILVFEVVVPSFWLLKHLTKLIFLTALIIDFGKKIFTYRKKGALQNGKPGKGKKNFLHSVDWKKISREYVQLLLFTLLMGGFFFIGVALSFLTLYIFVRVSSPHKTTYEEALKAHKLIDMPSFTRWYDTYLRLPYVVLFKSKAVLLDVLAHRVTQENGYGDPRYGRESYLKGLWKQYKKATLIQELETMNFQLNALIYWAKKKKEVLSSIDVKEAIPVVQKAWRKIKEGDKKGDLLSIETFIEQSLKVDTPEYKRVLLEYRNHTMVATLLKRYFKKRKKTDTPPLKNSSINHDPQLGRLSKLNPSIPAKTEAKYPKNYKGKRIFVAVGIAHLAGSNGILALLEKEGCTVKQLNTDGTFEEWTYSEVRQSI